MKGNDLSDRSDTISDQSPSSTSSEEGSAEGQFIWTVGGTRIRGWALCVLCRRLNAIIDRVDHQLRQALAATPAAVI